MPMLGLLRRTTAPSSLAGTSSTGASDPSSTTAANRDIYIPPQLTSRRSSVPSSDIQQRRPSSSRSALAVPFSILQRQTVGKLPRPPPSPIELREWPISVSETEYPGPGTEILKPEKEVCLTASPTTTSAIRPLPSTGGFTKEFSESPKVQKGGHRRSVSASTVAGPVKPEQAARQRSQTIWKEYWN